MKQGPMPLVRAVTLLVALLCAGMVRADDSEQITFPVPKLISSRDLQSTLAEVGLRTQPAVRALPAGTDIVDVLRIEYKDAAPSMWNTIQRANSRSVELQRILAPIKKLPKTLVLEHPVQTFVLPIGPAWDLKPSVVKANGGDTIESLALRYLGATAKTMRTAQALLRKDNPDMDFSKLRQGQNIKLSQRSFWRFATSADASRNLNGISGASSQGAPAGFAPIKTVASDETDCIADGPNWPVNWKAVLDVMSRNTALLKAANKAPARNVVVAVLDSGVRQTEFQLHRIKFWGNPASGQVGFDATKSEGNGYSSRPWSEFVDPLLRDHGTHVAGLVQGGDSENEIRTPLQALSEIMILKIVTQELGQQPSIPPDAIAGAISQALVVGHAAVFNLSVEPTRSMSTWDVLQSHKDVLFVVAAGNGQVGVVPRWIDLNDNILNPAHRGGPNFENIVSVAAHDSNGDLTDFSNRGKDSVTLAAPGCRIKSFVASDELTGILSGTSQASPIVSAVAALLSSHGLTAAEIKQRLIASVEWKENLEEYLFSGGLLSFEKALDIYSDILVRKPLSKGGSVERGLIKVKNSSGETNEVRASKERGGQIIRVPVNRILKLTWVAKDQAAAPIVRIVYIADGTPETVRVERVRLTSDVEFWPVGEASRPAKPGPGYDIVRRYLAPSDRR